MESAAADGPGGDPRGQAGSAADIARADALVLSPAGTAARVNPHGSRGVEGDGVRPWKAEKFKFSTDLAAAPPPLAT